MKSQPVLAWHRHRTAAKERGQWVRRYERSGLSRAAFARQHGLSVATLVRWMAAYATPMGPAADVPAVREVNVSPAVGSSPWVAEVQRPDGWVVRVNAAALPGPRAAYGLHGQFNLP